MRHLCVLLLPLISACPGGLLAPATCDDGEHNGLETGTDCGGPCRALCPPGAGCVADSDCLEGLCGEGQCSAPRCDDGILNGAETDLDCGGTCAVACGPEQQCIGPEDCVSGICRLDRCAAPSCDDGVHNGDEADLDCGQVCPQGCAEAQSCFEGSDCLSGVCEEGLCQAPRCDDQVRNGTETDVDCGGDCAHGCPFGAVCEEGRDCSSGLCEASRCDRGPVEACLSGPHADGDPRRAEACWMLGYLNADRALFVDEAGGALPLRWDPDLYLVAASHSADMCERAYFAHQNPDGESPSDRARRMGFPVPVAENIAINLDAASAQHAFMHEPTCTGHRGNILNPRNVTVGIGIIECDQPGFRWDGYVFYTQNFQMDFGRAESSYCQDSALACELPAAPVSTASAECPAQVVQWGWCDYDPAGIMAPRWNCPDD